MRAITITKPKNQTARAASHVWDHIFLSMCFYRWEFFHTCNKIILLQISGVCVIKNTYTLAHSQTINICALLYWLSINNNENHFEAQNQKSTSINSGISRRTNNSDYDDDDYDKVKKNERTNEQPFYKIASQLNKSA